MTHNGANLIFKYAKIKFYIDQDTHSISIVLWSILDEIHITYGTFKNAPEVGCWCFEFRTWACRSSPGLRPAPHSRLDILYFLKIGKQSKQGRDHLLKTKSGGHFSSFWFLSNFITTFNLSLTTKKPHIFHVFWWFYLIYKAKMRMMFNLVVENSTIMIFML